MTVMTTTPGLPFGRPLTCEDLEAFVEGRPDDGHRYELVDGTLIVTPAPSDAHQTVSGELAALLRRGCPDGMKMLSAPFAVVLAADTELHPDLLVARSEDFTHRNLPTAPVLAVEILSPSTRRVDLLLKRDRLQSAGCPHYWVVDPFEPRVIAWTLRDGVYVEAADVAGDDVLDLGEPFAVRLRPSALTRWKGADEPV